MGAPSAAIPLDVWTITLRSGGERPFYLRPGTTDKQVTVEVLGVKERPEDPPSIPSYDLRRLDRGRHPRKPAVIQMLANLRTRTGKKPLIVDAGANIGASPIFFLSEFPDATVIAIEPDAGNFDLLHKNVAGLAIGCVHGAASSRPGRVRVIDPGEGQWAYRTQAAPDGGVPCVMLNEIFHRYAATHFPWIVKVDIEGGEADLFSANTEWVEQTPVLIVEPHDWAIPNAGISRSLLKCISALNRDFIIVGEDIYSIANEVRVP
jgi:FkbM family methyltransferase